MLRSRDPVTDEGSLRYPGWRVVAACFAMALVCWGVDDWNKKSRVK